MNIKIGFSKPKGMLFPVFSWLIRLIECTKYSHVYLQWDSEIAQSKITYHAAGHAVNFLGTKKFNETVNPIYEFQLEITKDQYQELLHYCFENSGTDYGIKQIFGIAIVKIIGVFGKKISNPFSDGNKSQVCSELVGYVLSEIMDKDIKLDLDIAGPRDIFQFLKESEIKQIK